MKHLKRFVVIYAIIWLIAFVMELVWLFANSKP